MLPRFTIFVNAGEPFLGRIPYFLDRALPGPSPSANLVGIWKAFDRQREAAAMPAVFYFCQPLKER